MVSRGAPLSTTRTRRQGASAGEGDAARSSASGKRRGSVSGGSAEAGVLSCLRR